MIKKLNQTSNFFNREEGQAMSFSVNHSGKEPKVVLSMLFCLLGLIACASISQTVAAQTLEGNWIIDRAEI